MPSHEEMDHALNDAQSCLERLRKAFCDPLG